MKKLICVLISIAVVISALPVFAAAGESVFVFLKTAEKVIGNNYSNDNLPSFDADIKNTGTSAAEVTYKACALNSGGETVWSESGKTTVAAKSKATIRFVVDEKYYGVMTARISVAAGGKTVSASLPYTMSNHSADMPNNKKFGAVTHLNRGRGTIEDAVFLMKNAGIVIMRGEDMSWGEFEA